MQISPNEIARIAQIAFVLEPIANKPGLTTRYADRNRNLKLENFLVAGINTGDSFRELAKRVYESKDLPITYDIALQAQKDSFKNRQGSRLIYGGIISLFPLIITQTHIRSTDPYAILSNVEDVLKQTHREDAVHLQELENYAYGFGANHKQYMFDVKDEYENVWDYLEKDLISIGEITQTHWKDRAKTGSSNKEILNGYPIVKSMLDIYYSIVKNKEWRGISQTTEEIDFLIRREFPNAHIQWLADLHVCLMYLILCHENKEFFV